jgi:hypothetical protein
MIIPTVNQNANPFSLNKVLETLVAKATGPINIDAMKMNILRKVFFFFII